MSCALTSNGHALDADTSSTNMNNTTAIALHVDMFMVILTVAINLLREERFVHS
ncbi:hypothetical protein A359_01220 [secondary endosymbiont of Ctenarytaina eucalypti]|uniref:Uncharacterized protein n=1 Tax=secondary endosymbiont of Ctenarytaina eucalypti TaxID=1199245 RepID=J3TWW6_9ENTR|nr:hypothetical protein A359_01220 [secondary endosymbiont of Ctenarytaina eucalypti]